MDLDYKKLLNIWAEADNHETAFDTLFAEFEKLRPAPITNGITQAMIEAAAEAYGRAGSDWPEVIQEMLEAAERVRPAPTGDLLTAEERAEIETIRRAVANKNGDMYIMLGVVDRLAPKPAPVSPLEALAEEMAHMSKNGPLAGPSQERLYWRSRLLSAIAAEKAGSK